MRSLLFQASLPARYWAESLHAATYLFNLLPTKAISTPSPHFALFGTTPSYAHLWIFGCACYWNTSATTPHKLPPPSCRCVFLGYSFEHKGYRCLDLTMNRLLVSQHVVFDKSSFPFASSATPPNDLDSLFLFSPTVHAIAPPYPSSVAGTSETVAMPRATSAPPPVPHAAPAPTRPPTPRTTLGPRPRHAQPRRPRPRHAWPRLHASPSPPWSTSNNIRPPR
jgi:hypothetical protein